MRYDESLFAGTAGWYGKYRPRYPRAVFDRIVEVFEPSEGDVLLDLGCGTGELALPLAGRFGKVLAWDPDGEMLEVARRKAKEQGVANVIFEQKSSDDLPGLAEKVKLVAMGQSFHWMDGESTLEEIKKHLVDGGGVAIVGLKCGIHIYSSPDDWVEPLPTTAKRNKAILDAAVRYLGIERRAGKTTFKTSLQPWTDTLDEASFAEITECVFDEIRPRNIDETLGYIYSTTWGNKSQLGRKADEFETELRKKLQELSPSGVFEEKITFSLLTAKMVF